MVFNGILKSMPGASRTANYKQETINNKRKTVNFNKLFPVSSFQFPVFNKGFTLIELLVVITLFGIISSLIVASYLTFDNNQKIRSAAQTLKNDLRFAQNKALAGDKGVSNVSGGDCDNTSLCYPNFITPNNYYLVGWYVIFDTTQTSTYTYAGVCKSASGAESTFNSKTVNFPPGVVLHSVEIGGNPLSGTVVKVLLKPLTKCFAS